MLHTSVVIMVRNTNYYGSINVKKSEKTIKK